MPVNVKREIWLACTITGDVSPTTYVALHTTIDYDGLWDLIEMRDVSVSWNEAAIANNKEKAVT